MPAKRRAQAPRRRPSSLDRRYVVWEPWKLVAVAVFFLFLGVLLGWFTHAAYAPPGIASTSAPIAQNQNAQIRQLQDHIVQAEAQVRLRPQDGELRVHLGNLYYDLSVARDQLGDATGAQNAALKAIEHYEAARAQGVASPGVLTDLGTMYYHAGQPQKAVELYEHAIAMDENFPNAWMNMGIVKREALGDLQGAVHAWQRYLQINPVGPDADRVRMWLGQAGAVPEG